MSLRLTAYTALIGKREIVRNVSLQHARGSVMAILGPNGTGKSTFLKGLCGLRPASGRALLGEDDLLAMTPVERSRRVGYVSQDMAHLSVQLSVFELLLLAQNGGRHGWRSTAGSAARAEGILRLLKLEAFADRQPGSLSGGERQMIALAIALVKKPQLLLLDEPTSALDLANTLQMLDAVRDYTIRESIVTLAVLHDINLATRYADWVLTLSDGSAHACGRTRDMLTTDRLADLYGVDCRLIDVDGGAFTAVYPLSVIRPPTAPS